MCELWQAQQIAVEPLGSFDVGYVAGDGLDGTALSGLISRCVAPTPRSVVTHELTELGRALQPVIEELQRWSARLPG